MRWCALLALVGVALLVAVQESPAQIFGSKKSKAPASQRVPELIVALKVEKDGNKRADAAEELRQFDPKDFPEIVPLLVEALQSDPAANVRIEAATGLGRLRPISTAAGQALEKAAAADSNLRVRIQAKTSLLYYQMSGYHAPKKAEAQAPPVGRTDEPPLAVPGSQWWNNNASPPQTPPTTVFPGSSSFKPLPSGPSPNSKGPALNMQPPQPTTGPQLGPVISPPPATLQIPPAVQWAPVKDGPPLTPQKK